MDRIRKVDPEFEGKNIQSNTFPTQGVVFESGSNPLAEAADLEERFDTLTPSELKRLDDLTKTSTVTMQTTSDVGWRAFDPRTGNQKRREQRGAAAKREGFQPKVNKQGSSGMQRKMTPRPA